MKAKFQDEGLINSVSKDEIITALNSLETNTLYLTKAVHRYNTDKWPDNQIPFIDFHISYLKAHPTLDPRLYVSNLRLSLRKTPR